MGRIQGGPTLLAGIGDTRLGQTGRTHSGTGGTNVKARDAIVTVESSTLSPSIALLPKKSTTSSTTLFVFRCPLLLHCGA